MHQIPMRLFLALREFPISSLRRPPSSYHAIASVFSATVWSLYLLCLFLASILIFSYTWAARGRRKDGLSMGDRAWKAARFAGAPALGQSETNKIF